MSSHGGGGIFIEARARESTPKQAHVLAFSTMAQTPTARGRHEPASASPTSDTFTALTDRTTLQLATGTFPAALESVRAAKSLAETPQQRAHAAVLELQCLHECGSSDALPLALSLTTTRQPAISQTFALITVAASLALAARDYASAKRVLRVWLEHEGSDSDLYPPFSDMQREHLVFLLVNKCELEHDARADVLREAGPRLSEEAVGRLFASESGGMDGETERVAAEQGASLQQSVMATGRSVVNAGGLLARAAMRWAAREGFSGRVAAALVAAVFVVGLLRRRRRSLGIVWGAAVQLVRTALGGDAGVWTQ